MIPMFAVVGRSNKGKSSIVATLTENDQVVIAPTPRTTQHCQHFTMSSQGEKLFTIIDTPGFEEAPAVLEWLQKGNVDAHKRRERVQSFLEEFKDSEQFRYERELLKPIMEGAAILYVVDTSRPFRPNYETEFEILRWTGQASMALMNRIGDQDFSPDWRAALNQYFRKVKEFNAHKSLFADRLTLLEEMRVIHDDLRPALDRAILALKDQHRDRIHDSAGILAETIVEASQFQLNVAKKHTSLSTGDSENLIRRYQDRLRSLEEKSRQAICACFNYQNLETHVSELDKPIYEKDLFSHETWELLGLTRTKLILAGTAAGALAGGTLDAMVGGASVMIGTGLGALVGGTGTAYLAFTDPKIAGIKVAASRYVIGPNQNPNFPWILLDRGINFIAAVEGRTHAQRGSLSVPNSSGKQGLSASLPQNKLRTIAWLFKKAKWKLQREKAVGQLQQEIENLIHDYSQNPTM